MQKVSLEAWSKRIVLVAGLAWAALGRSEPEVPRHMIYLHGRIVQETQSPRPRHRQYGFYELEAIQEALRARGFVVSSEIRRKETTVSEAADRLVSQIRALLDSGVPPDHITVVGASMGAGIAFLAAARLQNRAVRFCTLGACLSENVRALAQEEGKSPMGFVLAIRESSDPVTRDCAAFIPDSLQSPGLTEREIVVDTGLAHGFLYRPLPEWVEPVVEWALHEVGSETGAPER